jgi:hypothetical protein
MPHAMLQTSEDIISGILNWVCPECGGPMGGPTKEFKCQGQCRRDWRAVWESRLAKPSKNTNLPQTSGKHSRDNAPNGKARVVVHKSANEINFRLDGGIARIAERLDSVNNRRGRRNLYAGRRFPGGRQTLRRALLTVAEAQSERQGSGGMRRSTR